MDLRAEHQTLLQYFHASHEFVRQPTFEECAFNEANSRITHVSHVH